MSGKKKIIWSCRGRKIDCAERTLVMGILNATPDSFSDGGKFKSLEKGVEHALEMLQSGADIIDIGGESTRPGSEPVQALEEIERTVPIIGKIREQSNCLISIDTMKAEVARAAVAAGADIINDVSACADPAMAAVVAEAGAGLVLMHMQGLPQTMQEDPQYGDAVFEVRKFLEERMAAVMQQGVAEEQICLDPGIGFGKTDEHNLALLNNIPNLAATGRPVLIGVSRKSLFGRLLGREVHERLAGSLATGVFSVMRGASILRVHDVKESCDAVRLVDRLRFQG
ncbi:dihydropteroate synthase [Tichowtungia aerotolerans]|uniref:Dihydropteroate synthase n=1 Tax=Tichowtungia aerotolerans TaxID=2697043 RepID=A0A6P1M461_9BACT|nr:dihydropteroate synthase [Tichowtungia aerotolerans]QHI68631.1 dihydropteroate synthase [Tichowtungia aerotolerans]